MINMCISVEYMCVAEKNAIAYRNFGKTANWVILEHPVYYIHLYSPELSAPHEVKMK